ncbi:MAG: patatin-like phospholipase family protein [Deltaproteobacteria bacterium]|nr:patatin-like phospholipase family protein [Deltaproteobacteria bacterium]
MGITIIQKSGRAKHKKGAKKALILAGGAVTGASFMAGGLKALNDYMDDFTVNDFDIYVGISAGSLLAAPLVGGISPEEMLKGLDGTSKEFTKFAGWHYYWPNFGEFVARPFAFLKKFLDDKTLPSLYEILPSGIFDNSPIEHYIRKNIERNDLTNNFKSTLKATGKYLYIVASILDGAKRAVFGPDEISSVTISKAIQASTAMPGFYKPVRINNADYVDGGVQDTASIDIAVKKGAKLIICYNPFRPHTKAGRLAGEGILAVLNQIFRTFFYSRLHVALEQYRDDPSFDGDIILIEPKDDDKDFFDLNPLILSNKTKGASLGFKSAMNSINEHYGDISKILALYGIKMKNRCQAPKL